MQLKDIINYHVETVGPDDTLQMAAEKMRDLDVGSIPVCDGDRLVGMVTDRDITIRATAEGDDPRATKIEAVMTPDVICCLEDQTVEEAATLMQEHQVRRLFVLNENKTLVGIISLGELSTATGDRHLAGETLERVSDSAEFRQEQEERLNDDGDEPESTDGVGFETRVTGIFEDSEQAKEAVLELKDAGFADARIVVAMQDSDAQDSFLADLQVQSVAVEEIPSLPVLGDGQVLVMVEAANLSAMALEIISRNHGTTGGVRVPS